MTIALVDEGVHEARRGKGPEPQDPETGSEVIVFGRVGFELALNDEARSARVNGTTNVRSIWEYLVNARHTRQRSIYYRSFRRCRRECSGITPIIFALRIALPNLR